MPQHLAQWWGPDGFTNPVCEFDARVGGALRIHMRGPDGTVYPMKGVIRELVAPERLVFSSVATDAAGKHLLEGLTTVTFAERNGKTTMTMHTRAVAVAEIGVGYLQGMEAGWTQSIDRLEASGAGRLAPPIRHARSPVSRYHARGPAGTPY